MPKAIIEIANQINQELMKLIFQELQEDNYICEASKGWPEKDSIFIQMKYPFKKRHSHSDEICFSLLHDRHYWHQEYKSSDPVHVLCCPFPK